MVHLWINTRHHDMIKLCLLLLHTFRNSNQKAGNSLRVNSVVKGRELSTNQQLSFGSVSKIWDVVIGVTPVTLGSVVGNSQVIKSRKENQEPYDDYRDGAVYMLETKKNRGDFKNLLLHMSDPLFIHYFVPSPSKKPSKTGTLLCNEMLQEAGESIVHSAGFNILVSGSPASMTHTSSEGEGSAGGTQTS